MSDVTVENTRHVAQGVMEALAIAVITGAVSSFITVKVQQRDIETLKEQLAEVKQQVNELRRDVYVPRGNALLQAPAR